MRPEPIISQDIRDLEPLTVLYRSSGFRLKVKRILGWWTLTPFV